MKILPIRIATAILVLLIVSPIQPLHVNAFESQPNPNKSQPIVGNGTLLDDGSIHEDIESMPLLNATKRPTNAYVSLQIFARKFQTTVNPRPKSLLENANTMYPTVAETSSPMDDFQEITGYEVHRTTMSTEDPPAQPDLLLLAKMKEIEAMEANQEGQKGEASQHRVAVIHAVAMLISMRTAPRLVQLLWE